MARESKLSQWGPRSAELLPSRCATRALTKGTSALHVAVLTAAASLGVSNELEQEFSYSQPDTLLRMRASVPHVAIPAARWIGEMEEIAASFEHAGSTAHFHQGAADIFRLLSRTPLAAENPEDARL